MHVKTTQCTLPWPHTKKGTDCDNYFELFNCKKKEEKKKREARLEGFRRLGQVNRDSVRLGRRLWTQQKPSAAVFSTRPSRWAALL